MTSDISASGVWETKSMTIGISAINAAPMDAPAPVPAPGPAMAVPIAVAPAKIAAFRSFSPAAPIPFTPPFGRKRLRMNPNRPKRRAGFDEPTRIAFCNFSKSPPAFSHVDLSFAAFTFCSFCAMPSRLPFTMPKNKPRPGARTMRRRPGPEIPVCDADALPERLYL